METWIKLKLQGRFLKDITSESNPVVWLKIQLRMLFRDSIVLIVHHKVLFYQLVHCTCTDVATYVVYMLIRNLTFIFENFTESFCTTYVHILFENI